jgi:hypothetical protein
MLKIVMPFLKEVFGNGEHLVIGLRQEDMARGDEEGSVIDLGSGLVEPIRQVVTVEGDEIDDRRSEHPDHLALVHKKRLAGISGNGHVLDDFLSGHSSFPPFLE